MIGVLLALVVAAGPVVLRDGTRLEEAAVAGFNDQGVVLRPAFDGGPAPGRALVPWGEVADVEGGWGEARPYREVAEAVGLAEARLARGDATGARALLEPLAARYLGRQGPTSAAVASALAACRSLREDRPGAVAAWLAWRASGGGAERAWIDQATGLAPALPPVWAASERAAAAEALAAVGRAADGGAAGELAVLYALSSNGPEDEAAYEGPEARLRADPGVRLVWEMVRAQNADARSDRDAARAALRRRLRPSEPAWQRAWARLGIGAGLLREDDRVEQDAGAGELLTVVLLHRDAAPGLSELALRLACEHFERSGRPGHAAAYRAIDLEAASGLRPGEPAAGATDETGADPEPGEEIP